MSASEHTPGPWRHEGYGLIGCILEDRKEWACVARVLANDPDAQAGEVQANARLIAAAPELLLAVEAALPYLFNAPLEGALDVHAVALRARDKALGEEVSS